MRGCIEICHYRKPGDEASIQSLGNLANTGPTLEVGQDAIRALMSIGRPALPTILGCLGSKHDEVGRIVLASLNHDWAERKAVIKTLTGLLSDREARTRRGAAEALELYGTDARDAAPVLRSRLKDEDEGVRNAARKALRAVDGKEGDR